MSKPRGASILAALLSLATLDARAGHTAHLDVFDASAPGCLAEGVWAAYKSEGTGEAWIVQPGREPLLYEFKGVPGPR